MLTPHEEMRVRQRLKMGNSPRRILLDFPEGVVLSEIEAVRSRLNCERDLAAACTFKQVERPKADKKPAWFRGLPVEVANVVVECCRQQGSSIADFAAYHSAAARRQAIYVLRVRWGFKREQVAEWFDLNATSISEGQCAWAVHVARKGPEQFVRLDPPRPDIAPAFRKSMGGLLTAIAGEYGVTERVVLQGHHFKGPIHKARRQLAYALLIKRKWERVAIADLMDCSSQSVFSMALAHAEDKGLLGEFNEAQKDQTKKAA